MFQSETVSKLFREFNDNEEICVNGERDANKLKNFLDFIEADYSSENDGDNWNFRNNQK
jgi:hypothetical protein